MNTKPTAKVFSKIGRKEFAKLIVARKQAAAEKAVRGTSETSK